MRNSSLLLSVLSLEWILSKRPLGLPHQYLTPSPSCPYRCWLSCRKYSRPDFLSVYIFPFWRIYNCDECKSSKKNLRSIRLLSKLGSVYAAWLNRLTFVFFYPYFRTLVFHFEMSQESEPILKYLPDNLGTPRLIDVDHYPNFTIEICRAIKIEDLVATALHNYQSGLLDKFFGDKPFNFRNILDGRGLKDFSIQKNADNTVKVRQQHGPCNAGNPTKFVDKAIRLAGSRRERPVGLYVSSMKSTSQVDGMRKARSMRTRKWPALFKPSLIGRHGFREVLRSVLEWIKKQPCWTGAILASLNAQALSKPLVWWCVWVPVLSLDLVSYHFHFGPQVLRRLKLQVHCHAFTTRSLIASCPVRSYQR